MIRDFIIGHDLIPVDPSWPAAAPHGANQTIHSFQKEVAVNAASEYGSLVLSIGLGVFPSCEGEVQISVKFVYDITDHAVQLERVFCSIPLVYHFDSLI